MKFSKPLWKTLCIMWITPVKFPETSSFFPRPVEKWRVRGALPFGVTNDGSFAQDRPLTRFAGAPPKGEPNLFPPKLQTYGKSRFLRKTQFFAIQSSLDSKTFLERKVLAGLGAAPQKVPVSSYFPRTFSMASTAKRSQRSL